FRLGRRAFAARDFRRADELFNDARRGAEPELIKSAAYYLGWTALNRQEYRRAADAFASILDTAARVGSRSSSAPPDGGHASLTLSAFSESEAAFLTDVINALLLSFDYVGGAKELRAYLEATGRRPYETLLYRTMGTLYQAQDRTADAVEAYTAFLEAAPLHPDAPVFQQAIADAYTKAQWQLPLLEARERLIDRYGPESDWARANGDAARLTARRLVKNALYDLALYDHAQAQARRQPAAYERALARHERFLAVFPRDIDAARVAWLRADALFELGRYAAASAAYRQTAYEYPLHAQSREAGYAAVVAWERTVPTDRPPPAEAVDGLLNHVNRFVNTFADDSRNPDLLMKVAETAARAGLPRQARDTAQRLVADYPRSRWSGAALRLIGQAWYDQGEYAAAEDAFRRALAGATGAQAQTVSGLAAAALYQTATARRSAGDTAGAGAAYLKVAGDFPATPFAPAALNDAAEMRAAAGETPAAIGLWTRLAVEYPAAGQTPAALRKLAEAALLRNDRLQAIDWYDRLARRSDAPTQTQLAWTIADLAEQAGDWPRAERELAALAGRAELPPAQAIEAGFRAAHASARRGNAAEARERTAVTLDRYHAWRAQRPPGASLTAADRLAAAALMESADRLAAAATALRLIDPLERSLADKRAALNTALDAYAAIVEMKVGATAATHKIGMLLDDFFQAVLGSDRPRDLTPEQLEQYEFLLEEQAAPFEDRAVAAYEANVRRTHQLGLYDEWIERSFARLAVLRPARYRRPELDALLRDGPMRAP
ncbi:MAG: tetratricopeptide repeat protein, partial [Nitrospiria bacterium]